EWQRATCARGFAVAASLQCHERMMKLAILSACALVGCGDANIGPGDGGGSDASGAFDSSDGTTSDADVGQPVPYTCNTGSLSPSSPKGVLIKCSMMHQEYSPSTPIQRNFGVFIPNGYVA